MPALTPTYGLSSTARTGLAVLVSSPRTKIGSQGRIYSYYSRLGQGNLYMNYLANQVGTKYLPQVNPMSIIFM